MSKLSKRIILLFFVIISLGFVGLFVIDKATNSRINNIGVIGKVPNFSLTNFDGEEVTSSILNNKITIVNFMFTQCEDACLIMSENLSLLQERFAQSNDIQFLSITTDPDFDSLEILNDYQKKYSKKNNWFFARGNIIDIINLSEKGFFLSAKLLPAGHSTRLILVDQNNQIRKYYEGTVDVNIFEMQSDIVTLINQM
tara:strand:- start:2221 stop:2814 length:594 start_codon:yes stop_codon:yes gene_type:complete